MVKIKRINPSIYGYNTTINIYKPNHLYLDNPNIKILIT